jgi:hypothetical protein
MSNKPEKRGDQKALELKMARKTRITETISLLPPRTMIFCEGTKNECFELWLLLHFILLESNISRADYMEKLVGYIPSYHKSATDIFSRLKDRVGTAIKNAKTIEGKFDVNATPSEMAPCTLVYRLGEELLRYV